MSFKKMNFQITFSVRENRRDNVMNRTRDLVLRTNLLPGTGKARPDQVRLHKM
jgi:hypothetical protein